MVGGVLGIGAETVENIQDGEGGGEAGERILEPQEVTLKNIYDLLNELSETNNHISEHFSWQESHEDSGTANLPKTNDADEGDEDEEQGSDDENDLLVRFGSLGRSLKTFQCDQCMGFHVCVEERRRYGWLIFAVLWVNTSGRGLINH